MEKMNEELLRRTRVDCIFKEKPVSDDILNGEKYAGQNKLP